MWADIHGARKLCCSLCGIGVLGDSGRGRSDAIGVLWKEKAVGTATSGDSSTPPRSGRRLGGATRDCWTMSSTHVEVEAVGD